MCKWSVPVSAALALLALGMDGCAHQADQFAVEANAKLTQSLDPQLKRLASLGVTRVACEEGALSFQQVPTIEVKEEVATAPNLGGPYTTLFCPGSYNENHNTDEKGGDAAKDYLSFEVSEDAHGVLVAQIKDRTMDYAREGRYSESVIAGRLADYLSKVSDQATTLQHDQLGWRDPHSPNPATATAATGKP